MVRVEFFSNSKEWLPFVPLEGFRTWNLALKACREFVLETKKDRIFRLTANVEGKPWVKYYRVAYEVKASAYYIDVNKTLKDVIQICNEFAEVIKGVQDNASTE